MKYLAFDQLLIKYLSTLRSWNFAGLPLLLHHLHRIRFKRWCLEFSLTYTREKLEISNIFSLVYKKEFQKIKNPSFLQSNVGTFITDFFHLSEFNVSIWIIKIFSATCGLFECWENTGDKRAGGSDLRSNSLPNPHCPTDLP